MWNTGVIAPGAAAAGTAPTVVAQGRPGDGSTTAEFGAPLLAGLSVAGDDDGGQGYGERPPDDGRGSRWLKPVLFAVAAVLAIALGVFFATRDHGGGHGDGPSTSKSPSVTHSTGAPTQETTSEPSDTESTDTGSPDDTGTPTSPTPTTPTTTPSTTPTTPRTTPPTRNTTPPTTATTTPPTASPTTPPATLPTPTGVDTPEG
jgi:hypothetical protein